MFLIGKISIVAVPVAVPVTFIHPSLCTVHVTPFDDPFAAFESSKFFPHTVTFVGCTPARVYGLSGPLSPSPVSAVAPSTAARRSAPVGDTSSSAATGPEAVPVSTLAYRLSLSPAV